jgi:putative salt-induced outer membrane protein YdiY
MRPHHPIRRIVRLVLPVLAALSLLVVPLPLLGQEEDPEEDEARRRWVFEGELTTVISQGNSEATTLGFGSTVRRRWARDAVRIEGGWVRVETGRISRRAVGTPDDFSVERSVDTDKTAEASFLRGRYDRTLSERFFVYGGADWLRNTFAGIESRLLLAVGGGNQWTDSDATRFSTNYAFTYTFQEDVVENPFLETDFAGVRVGWEYFRRISGSAQFESVLVSDLNLQETDDLRFDLVNSLQVAVNEAIALKPSLQLLWRNQPSLTEVPLFTGGGADTGETVQAPLRKLDALFRMALVLTF